MTTPPKSGSSSSPKEASPKEAPPKEAPPKEAPPKSGSSSSPKEAPPKDAPPKDASASTSTTMTQEEARSIATAIKKSGSKNKASAITNQQMDVLLNAMEKIFSAESMLIEVDPPVVICGDIHGQIHDLLRLFRDYGQPPQRRYLFLGDYVDRGPQNTDTIVFLMALKFLYPKDLFLLRGNHETKPVNAVYGFKTELEQRFPEKPEFKPNGKELWKSFNRVFDFMPLAGRVGERILCMHGGISPHLTHLSQIARLERPLSKLPDKGIEVDLLWADPDPNAKGFVASARGVSYLFGPQAVIDKCEELGLDLIVRAHQVMHEGYEYFAGNHLLTLFTAPDYSGQFDNHGAVLHVSEVLELKIKVLSSRTRALQKPTQPPKDAPKT